MTLHFLAGQRFECTACAKCCHGQGWSIAVDARSAGKLKGSLLELRVLQEREIPALVRDDEGNLVVNKHEGACVFLRDDSLCGVHAEMGADVKPLGCRQFPFLFTQTPDGLVVGVSFFCSSIQRNSGQPLESYQAELEKLLKESRPTTVGRTPLVLRPGVKVTWEIYRALEAFLGDHLESDPLIAGRVVWALCRPHRLEPTSESIQELLEGSLEVDLRSDPFLEWMEIYFAKSLIGRLEGGPEVIQALDQDLPVRYKTADWEGTLSQVLAYAGERHAHTIAWLAPEILRYQRSLLFNKMLAKERPVLENLLVFFLLPRVLEYYTFLRALARKAERPEPSDFWGALDLVEGHLVTHGREASAMSQSFLRFYLERAQAGSDRG